MPSSSVATAVDSYLSANFSTCPVFTLNDGSEAPADGSNFVQVQYPLGIEDQRSIGAPGANCFREEGAVRFVINTGKTAGSAAVLALADELRALMRNKRFDGVRTFEAPPATLDDESDHPRYFQASFAVAYEFDITA